jgi:hypothetical protein
VERTFGDGATKEVELSWAQPQDTTCLFLVSLALACESAWEMKHTLEQITLKQPHGSGIVSIEAFLTSEAGGLDETRQRRVSRGYAQTNSGFVQGAMWRRRAEVREMRKHVRSAAARAQSIKHV